MYVDWLAWLILADPFWETDTKEQLKIIIGSVLVEELPLPTISCN